MSDKPKVTRFSMDEVYEEAGFCRPVEACPQCKGRGAGEGFITKADGCSYGAIKCSLCEGTGEVSWLRLERLRVGELLRQERLSRDKSGREEAKRIGVDVIVLNHLEHGRGPIIEQFKDFRKDGWPVCPKCGDEELWCPGFVAWTREEDKPTLAQCYFKGFKCYRCSWESAEERTR